MKNTTSLLYSTLDMNNPAKRSELVEFRNYVRQAAYARLEQKEQPKPVSNTFHSSSKSFMSQKPLYAQSKVYVEQTLPSARGLNKSPLQRAYRSQSQSYVQFDANTWKENQNSFSRDMSGQQSVAVADLIKLNNRLSMISTKETKELSTNYMHSIQELEQTICSFLRRVDNKI